MDARMDSIYHIVFTGNIDGTATFLMSFYPLKRHL